MSVMKLSVFCMNPLYHDVWQGSASSIVKLGSLSKHTLLKLHIV
jgi:hypothetical protein